MDQTTFEKLMLSQLGGNLVDIELTQDDYDAGFLLAKQKYQQYGNDSWNLVYLTLNVSPGVTTYTLTDNVVEIIEIIKPGSGFYPENPFHRAIISDLVSPMFSGGGNSCMGGDAGGGFLDYYLTTSYLEQIEHMTANDVRFHYNRFSKVLTLKTQPSTSETWLMETYLNSTDDIYRDIPWIQNWTLAELKSILGLAYRKFSTLDNPAGQDSLHGAELITESETMKEALLQEIKDYVDGEPHISGGVLIG